MTTVDPGPTTRRRKRRSSTPSTSTTPARSRGVRITRGILTGLWLVGVPAFAGAHIDHQFGEKLAAGLGAGPAFGVAAAVAVAAFAVAWFLHRRHLVAMFAVTPAVVSWVGYFAFGGGTGGWLGLFAGLGLGVLAHWWRQRPSR